MLCSLLGAVSGLTLLATPAPSVTVGVLPVVSFVRSVQDIYQERPAVRSLRDQAGRWQRQLEHAVGGLDGVRVHSEGALKSRLLTRAGREAVAVGRERYMLGVEQYHDLDVEQATAHLARAGQLFMGAFIDLVNPREVADIALYEGLSVIESGATSRAHMAFRRMWTMDPARSFDRGYYPRATEETLEAAFDDLLTTPDLLTLRWPSERLSAMSQRAGIDLWLSAVIVGTVDAPVLHIRGHDPARGVATLDAQFPLDGQVGERVDRALSAWHACHVALTPSDPAPPPRRHRWYVDVSYAHTLMLFHANTRDVFQSPGVSVGVTWEGLDFLHAYGQLSYMASVPDPNGDLLRPFVATRVSGGAGLTGGSRRFRGFFRVGFEVAVSLTDIKMTQDVQCKHWGTAHSLCNQDRVFVDQSPGTWLGFVFGAGLRWAMVDTWYLATSIELASYVADAESELIDDLNFPLSMSLGVGTRF